METVFKSLKTFAYRSILIQWEKKPQNYLALFHFVCTIITYKQIGLSG